MRIDWSTIVRSGWDPVAKRPRTERLSGEINDYAILQLSSEEFREQSSEDELPESARQYSIVLLTKEQCARYMDRLPTFQPTWSRSARALTHTLLLRLALAVKRRRASKVCTSRRSLGEMTDDDIRALSPDDYRRLRGEV